MPQSTRDIIGDAQNISQYPGIFPSLTDYAQAKMNTYSWEVPDINLLIPGDVVWMNGHISIIDKINFDENRQTDAGNIVFIEATTYYKLLYVRNTITMRTHQTDGANILSYRRLIPNN